MAVFKVWAPKARNVEIEIGGGRHPMGARPGNWRELEVTWARPGDNYWFVLDSKRRLPDPRSQSQPQGIDGPSQLVDHSAFGWKHDRWKVTPLNEALIYELHVGTFSSEGTFDGVLSHLDHLVDLGVTHVELMPVNEFSGSYGWGYDSVDIYAPHHAYGGPDGLKRLIDGCHGRGLAVIADVVYNHFGPVGNYLDSFGDYFTDRYATPWGRAVNLDGSGSDEVRGYFFDHARMMLRDYRFDGLRLDAIHAIYDMSAIHFLEELAAETRKLEVELDRKLVLIAESDLNDPRIVQRTEKGGYGLDAQWSDDFHHALHALLTGERTGYYGDFGSVAALAKAIRQAYVYDGCYSAFRKRRHGREPRGLSGVNFLAYLQNHDQVGNRAQGDRSAHLMDIARLKIAAALVLMSPFVPLLFQGEEWAASSPFLYFTNHRDGRLGEAVRQGRRREFAGFGWKPEDVPDPQAPETFLRSKLKWNEIAEAPHREMLEWHRTLIRLRRENPAVTRTPLEDTKVQFDDRARWLSVQRGPISIVGNFADTENVVPCAEGRVLLASRGTGRGPGQVTMPPVSVAIVTTDA